MATYTLTKNFADTWSDLSWWGFDLDQAKISTANGVGRAKYTLLWNGGADPGYDKIIIEITFDPDQDLEVLDVGDMAGIKTLTGGEITSITYKDDGARVAQITDVPEVLTPYLASLSLSGGDVPRAYDLLLSQDNTYIGTAIGTDDDWPTVPADRIFTGYGNDKVNAKGGDDTIYDRGGRDTYNGGQGEDMVSYNQFWWSPLGIDQGIVADLATGEITGPDGYRDKVNSIEQVEGTFLDDVIAGDASDNVFAGLGGADQFDGRDGYDTLNYGQDRDQNGFGGIKVEMGQQTIRDGFGHTDSFTDIEHIIGTYTRDNFVDSDEAMLYEGRDGDDIFRIRGGDDTLIGGDGADQFNFIGTDFGENVLKDWEPEDIITINKLTDASQLSIFQVGSSAVVVFAKSGVSSSLVFENTESSDLTLDVFGL